MKNLGQKKAFSEEMKLALACMSQGELDQSFFHLERAHILGQTTVISHIRSHWWMLRVGWTRHDMAEVRGQILRIIFALLFSRLWVPLGNTGGANVNPLKRMSLPEDLKHIMKRLR